ncbi:MAG TPA: hypothetical protein VNS88_09885 [Nitrospiraceae bacterium]|nr:hypothetical protein [Nitrospiraceae bacterium]
MTDEPLTSVRIVRLVSVPRWGTTWIFKLLIFTGLRKVILVQPLKWILLRDV